MILISDNTKRLRQWMIRKTKSMPFLILLPSEFFQNWSNLMSIPFPWTMVSFPFKDFESFFRNYVAYSLIYFYIKKENKW